ncbi:hypothetical protein [Dysosmobacter sp.]|uniref:hypothetical protein n=1 Tax=Dysosmobacter sp. TaxID=2591382 RepID=UPI002A9B3AE7|nr:hypothetical protein [Dysosmobacter sp.]MDY5509141.1 hypothetical protein [Dysosmobacter sp.]
MKKSNLWAGLAEIALGLAFLVAAFFWVEGTMGSLLCGLGGGFLGSGGELVWKYWKWTRPQNVERYREKLEQEEIDLRDERKELLRCKAGRYAYQLGFAVCCVAAFLVALLGALGVIEHYLPLLCFLAAYLVFQYAAGLWFYRRLERKY